jgi:hypothetical protein
MSSTPATPVAAPTVTQTWIQKHERVIIVALVLLAGSWAYGKYANLASSKAEARANAAEQALVLQNATDAQLAAQTAQVLAQHQAIEQAYAALQTATAAAAASRQASVVQQQKTDATLPAADLANRMKTQAKAPEGSITVSGDTLNLTRVGAVAVVQALDTIPALQADLDDETALAQSAISAKNSGDEVIAAQTKEITGLQTAAVDQQKACTAQIAAVKADARKSKIKAFKWGFVAGFLSGLWAGHSAGL